MSTTQKVSKSSPMTMNFQTTLNGRTFRGTVNINDALKALKGSSLPQIYKQDGTKYSP